MSTLPIYFHTSSLPQENRVRRSTVILEATTSIEDEEDMIKEDMPTNKKRIMLFTIISLLIGVLVIIVVAATTEHKAKKVIQGSMQATPTTPAAVIPDPAVPILPADTTTKLPELSKGEQQQQTNTPITNVPNGANSSASDVSSNTPVQPLSVTSDLTTAVPPSSSLPTYHYVDSKFDWKNINNWEWADGSSMNNAQSKFSDNGITVDRSIRATPMRTKKGWHGEKVVYIEWTSTDQSDTNIWMLNTKIQSQFTANNGWPYYGEIDIFEMFTNDANLQKTYDFKGFMNFASVGSYGQTTLHYSTNLNSNAPCFCPAAPSKTAWYQGQYGMTSGCTAQFQNTPNVKNTIALVFGSDENGKYLQVVQYPSLIQGADNTYDFRITDQSKKSMKVYNNKDTYWGSKISECNSAGQNPSTGFPFFEDFRLILEEQSNGKFVVENIKILMG